MSQPTKLRRTLTLPMMVLYGLGTTIGAGIYALVGEIANVSGYFAPISFLIAALLASFTAISFAELSSRYPRAAGVALYTKEAFKSQRLSTLMGMFVILAGLVSAAALVNGFVIYLDEFLSVERTIAIIIVTALLTLIAIWGIAESVTVASIVTVIELTGLVIIIAVSAESISTIENHWHKLIPSASSAQWTGIFLGSILSFYAFIGFEDMIDVAEEIKDVKHTLPRAIVLTLLITTIVYLLLMLTAVLSLSPEQLSDSKVPLVTLFEHHVGSGGSIISSIGMIAIINGALIQIIMASRVIYGLASRQQLPKCLSSINQLTQTPILATLLSSSIVITLALIGRLASLAEVTSLIILIIFSVVNLALWRIKRQTPQPNDIRVYPLWIPIIGFFVSASFVISKCLLLFH